MVWDYQQTLTNADLLLVPYAFESPVLAIDITCTNQQGTWYRSGYLQTIVDIHALDFIGKKYTLGFGRQLVEIPYRAYRLSFAPVDWLQNTSIKIKQLSNAELTNLMPLYAAMPTTIGQTPITDSVPTTFAAPQYLAATLPAAYQALPANATRQGFAVTNAGTATVYLDLDAPTALSKRFASIPASSTYVSDFVYLGAVFVWSTNATSQSVEVREFV